jgi:hypothetical protein
MRAPATPLLFGLLHLVLPPAGCGGDPSQPPASPATPSAEPASREGGQEIAEADDVAGLTRAELEGVASWSTNGATVPERPAEGTMIARPILSLARLADVEAEDGAGGRIRASRAIAFDLDARRVPPRALDPVLRVGARTLRHYTHPRPGTLRFVLDETALPADGAPVSVQYGDDEASRLALGAVDRAEITGEL